MPRSNPLSTLRAGLFYAGLVLLTIFFGLTGPLLWKLPYAIRGRYMVCWNSCIVEWLRLTCGIRYRVIGAEHLPPAPYVALVNHRSQWETFFLQRYLFPVCFVLKRELLSMPFFGWGLQVMGSIGIDRSNPKKAIRDTLELGKQRLADGISVLIFPEGTRVRAGQQKAFARGGAGLAIAAGVPIVPIAHNAEICWIEGSFIKQPGTITVVIGQPLATEGGDSRALTEQAENWVREQLAEMDATVSAQSLEPV